MTTCLTSSDSVVGEATYPDVEGKERDDFFLSNGYTLKDFWNFWSRNMRDPMMEVRLKCHYQLIQRIGQVGNLPYSYSGVFVDSYEKLLPLVRDIRHKMTMWYSVNPRRKSYHYKNPQHKTYNGTDYSVDAISHIFIDVDRLRDDNPIATRKDLLENYEFTKYCLIEDLKEYGITDYMFIYSGNGSQLLIPLDVPIYLPELEWNVKTKQYEGDIEYFENLKKLVKTIIGKPLANRYSKKKYTDMFNVAIDMTTFNIGRVGALPYSFNFKKDGKIMRGIVEIKQTDNNNAGLSDALLNEVDSINTSPIYNTNVKKVYRLNSSFRLTAKKLKDDKLVRFILDNDLPEGGRNNSVLYSLKCLIKDNGIKFDAPEVREIQRLIEAKWHRTSPFNVPPKGFHFNPEVVNNYCIEHGLSLLYRPYPDKAIKNKFEDVKDIIWDWENYKLHVKLNKLHEYTDYNMPNNTCKKEDILKVTKAKDIFELYRYLYFVEQKYGEKFAYKALHEYLPYYTMKIQ